MFYCRLRALRIGLSLIPSVPRFFPLFPRGRSSRRDTSPGSNRWRPKKINLFTASGLVCLIPLTLRDSLLAEDGTAPCRTHARTHAAAFVAPSEERWALPLRAFFTSPRSVPTAPFVLSLAPVSLVNDHRANEPLLFIACTLLSVIRMANGGLVAPI